MDFDALAPTERPPATCKPVGKALRVVLILSLLVIGVLGIGLGGPITCTPWTGIYFAKCIVRNFPPGSDTKRLISFLEFRNYERIVDPEMTKFYYYRIEFPDTSRISVSFYNNDGLIKNLSIPPYVISRNDVMVWEY